MNIICLFLSGFLNILNLTNVDALRNGFRSPWVTLSASTPQGAEIQVKRRYISAASLDCTLFDSRAPLLTV